MVPTAIAGTTDVHNCPMPSGATIHGPGVVTQDSKSVFINRLPAVRQGDNVYEACGGADAIAIGCTNVFIGDAGGTAGDGAAAPAAQAVEQARAAEKAVQEALDELALVQAAAAVGQQNRAAAASGKGFCEICDSSHAGGTVETTAPSDDASVPSELAGAPAYDPDFWNADEVRQYTNCYSYACNDPNGHSYLSKAQPGYRVGCRYSQEDCGACVGAAAVCDGLEPAPDPPTPRAGYYLVALLTRTGAGYHWCRQDNNGRWSHKVGSNPVTDVDYSDQPINDPKTANLGYDFYAYYYVPEGGIKTAVMGEESEPGTCRRGNGCQGNWQCTRQPGCH